ncbi:hypothetical protein JTB14_007441 [Gonioctena quinquepunctata]|nr:hypothetical protein JTB14_007441 [Gonioctena quinquepunctata]
MEATFRIILENFIDSKYLRDKDGNPKQVENIQYKNPHFFLPLNQIVLPPKVFVEFNSENQYSEIQKEEFRRRCLDFYVEAASHLHQRFPFGSKFVQSLKLLNFMDPKNIKDNLSIANVANTFKNIVSDINELEREWKVLRNSDISTTMKMSDFWACVANTKKGDDSEAFPNLSRFVKDLLCLPHSSAAVERVFSQISSNKTKSRNKLQPDTLSAILHSKRYLTNENCYDFDIKPDLHKYSLKDIYK